MVEKEDATAGSEEIYQNANKYVKNLRIMRSRGETLLHRKIFYVHLLPESASSTYK